jgi:hypothetical protein
MSSSQAIQRRRKAHGATESTQRSVAPPVNSLNKTGPPPTLNQIIAHIDTRIQTLEVFHKSQIEINEDIEIKYTTTASSRQLDLEHNLDSVDTVDTVDTVDIHDEYEHRFLMLGNEINELKDIILKLQSFTMSVNKVLFDNSLDKPLKSTFESMMEQSQNGIVDNVV